MRTSPIYLVVLHTLLTMSKNWSFVLCSDQTVTQVSDPFAKGHLMESCFRFYSSWEWGPVLACNGWELSHFIFCIHILGAWCLSPIDTTFSEDTHVRLHQDLHQEKRSCRSFVAVLFQKKQASSHKSCWQQDLVGTTYNKCLLSFNKIQNA